MPALSMLLTIMAYWAALRGGFVWDDGFHVTEIQALRSLEGLGKIWLKPGTTRPYYPLTFTGFWVENHLGQMWRFGCHLVDILLHAFNAALVWRVPASKAHRSTKFEVVTGGDIT